jgi:hypothetical protein
MDLIDLNILSLTRKDGQDQMEPPGLLIATPPRRTARGRQTDRLVLYLLIAGNAPLPADQLNQLLTRLAQTYYKTSGSATAAQRAVADALNQNLLERNQKGVSSGRQGVGFLSIITLRNDHLYLAQSGPMHAFLINAAGAKHIHDPQISGRGLGLSRTTLIHYSQADLNPYDALVVSPQPPATWTAATLSGLHNQSPESLKYHLLDKAAPTVRAMLFQASRGTGKTTLLHPVPGQPVTYVQPKTETTPTAIPADQPEPSAPAIAIAAGVYETARIPDAQFVPPETPEQPQVPPFAQVTKADLDSQVSVQAAVPESPADEEEQPAAPSQAKTRRERRAAGEGRAASIGKGITAAIARAGLGIRNLFLRMLPGESVATLPSSVMITVAVLVPLFVVAIAAVVYFQSGRAGQFEAVYAQAVQAAGIARTQSDPTQKMAAWQNVINYLEQAEEYEVTAETQALRDEARQAYDDLNLVTRLGYQPALTSNLQENTRITHLIATSSDLYLLNAEGGNVIRTFATASGYEVDPSFQCASGLPAGQTGQLIDIAQAPSVNDFNATIQALDINGNLLQCMPGQVPVFTPLTQPSKGWGKPEALSVDLGNLYLLDPQKNTVWIYWDSNYNEQPEEFFVADFPMENVIDLVVVNTDLYLLHKDGHTTLCTYSQLSVSPSRCVDNLPYVDSRPGHEGQPMQIQPPFTQLLTSQPPDPSLFYLQPEEHAVYRFSLQLLTYYGQFRPSNEAITGITRKPATAFALSPDARLAFLAVDNQVFYAGMP